MYQYDRIFVLLRWEKNIFGNGSAFLSYHGIISLTNGKRTTCDLKLMCQRIMKLCSSWYHFKRRMRNVAR